MEINMPVSDILEARSDAKIKALDKFNSDPNFPKEYVPVFVECVGQGFDMAIRYIESIKECEKTIVSD